MTRHLLIGNLSLETNESALGSFFSKVGSVESVDLVVDPQSGKRKGFAFLSMSSISSATQAVKQLNGEELDGRAIVVNLSKNVETSFITKIKDLVKRS